MKDDDCCVIMTKMINKITYTLTYVRFRKKSEDAFTNNRIA